MSGRGVDGVHSVERLPYGPSFWANLAPVWQTALHLDPNASAYQSTEWMSAWIETFGERLRPSAFVFRDVSGAPLGACLLSISNGHLGPFPVRRAWLNATGESAVGSEHNTFLGAPGVRARMASTVASEAARYGADQFMLVGFRMDAADLMREAWPAGGRSGYESEDRFVDLAALRANGGNYMASLSRNTREQVRRAERLYTERFGAPVLELASGPSSARERLDELVSLHEQRWRARGESGAFASREVRAFHDALRGACASSERSAESLRIDLVRVRFGEETVAVLYNLVFRGTVSFYQSGLRYHEDNRLKPGLVAHAMLIQHYLAQGELQYDFLAGEPTAIQYKRSLAKDSRHLLWEELAAPTIKMRMVGAIRALLERRRDARAASAQAVLEEG